MITRPRDVDAALARTVLVLSFPEQAVAEPRRVEWTVNFVDRRIRGTSMIMRMGVRTAACTLGLALRLLDGVRLRADGSEAAAEPIRRWMDRPLPVLAEYTRLVRSLTLVGWFDAPDSVRG
jgi:hypothetical protein